MQINNGHLSAEILAQYGPRLKGAVPGPKARAIVEADHRVVSPSYTRSYPMVAKRGRGIRLEDVDGNEFLDFAAGIAVCSTGHCHPEVVAAIQQQSAELIHASGTDFYYEHMVQIAERLSAVAPMPGPHRFYFGNSAPRPSRPRSKSRAIIPGGSSWSPFSALSMAAPWVLCRSPPPRRSSGGASLLWCRA